MIISASRSRPLPIRAQAQCILFARYPEVLAPFKYAGYPMLLDAVTIPEDGGGGGGGSHFLGPDRAPQLQVPPSQYSNNSGFEYFKDRKFTKSIAA